MIEPAGRKFIRPGLRVLSPIRFRPAISVCRLMTIGCYLLSIEFRLSIKFRILNRFPFFYYVSFSFFLGSFINFSNRFLILIALKQRIYGYFKPFDKYFYFCYNLIGKNLKEFFGNYEFTGYLKDLRKNGKTLKSPKSNGSVIINR